MKVKELIDLLSKEDPDADVCADGPNTYDISDVMATTIQEKKVVAILTNNLFYGFPTKLGFVESKEMGEQLDRTVRGE